MPTQTVLILIETKLYNNFDPSGAVRESRDKFQDLSS